MKRAAISTLVFLLSFAAIGQARAASAPPTTVPDFQRDLEQRVAPYPGTGIIVGIIDHGKVVVYKAGSTGGPGALNEQTLFEIGSVTKTFTATILSQLVLAGKIALDDPVSKYLPVSARMPAHGGKRITFLNLATQHSGLPRMPANIEMGDGSDPYATYTTADMYRFLRDYELTRDPGVTFEYSNLGVGLLGQALANREGISYETLLEKTVLEPLGMHETAIALPPSLKTRLAVGHDSDGNPVKNWTFKAIAPAGGIRSSLADMLKYLRCNMGEGPLAKICLNAQVPRATMPGGKIGLIWWTNPHGIINHGGDTMGYHAGIAISPDHRRGVVVLSNVTSAEDIMIHAIDPRYPMAVNDPVAHVDPASLEPYAGVYTASLLGQHADFTVTRNGERLMVQLTGQPAARVFPAKPDQFFYHDVDAEIDFQRDGAGKIIALDLYQDGAIVQAIRHGVTDKVAAAPPKPYPPVVALDATTLQSYVGRYVVNPDVAFTVTREGDKLTVKSSGNPGHEVYASGKDNFFYKVVDAQLVFVRDASGKVTGLTVHQLGVRLNAVKQ